MLNKSLVAVDSHGSLGPILLCLVDRVLKLFREVFMSLTQREGVYVSTMNVLAEASINFDDGQAGGVEAVVTKELRARIISVVTTSIMSGEVVMSDEGRAKYDSEKKMSTYVNGLVSNWFHKDLRLNGNAKHQIKNPGSRAGAGDEQLKALKALRSAKSDDQVALTQIDNAIAERKAELNQKKAPQITEEVLALIPASLRSKLNI